MRRFSGGLIVLINRAAVALTPGAILAFYVRMFFLHGVRRGERKIASRDRFRRIIVSAAAPFSTLTLEVRGRITEVSMIPWLSWFRGSIFYRSLSRDQMIEISNRVTEKVDIRVCIPAGPSLPVGLRPGVLVDATGSVVEWLIDRFVWERY